MAEPSFPVKLMLQRSAQFLEQVIVPELTTPFSIQKTVLLARMLSILAATVEEKGQDLIEENGSMREAMERVLEVLREAAESSENVVRDKLIEMLDQVLKEVDVAARDLSDKNRMLKQALVDVISDFDSVADNLPEESAASLRKQIRSALRQQLDHGLARIGVTSDFG